MELRTRWALPKIVFTCLISLSLLSAPMTACAEDLVRLINKGEVSPYRGILLPESEYIFLEASNEEKEVCLTEISKVPLGAMGESLAPPDSSIKDKIYIGIIVVLTIALGIKSL